ncbi:MAG: hypothetical protein V3U84_03080 [Thiotrichaceae bacterium]
MTEDPIVNETRKIRDQIASEHGYDIYQLGRYLMEKQTHEGREIISRPHNRTVQSDSLDARY